MGKLSLIDKLFRIRAAGYITGEISPYIKRGSKILDIGCGSGITSWQIANKLGTKISLVDVVNKNKVDLPFTVYDGKKIPFKDKSFDVSLLIFVLHHADDAQLLLLEAKRVTKDKIIIYEDIITKNPFDKIDSFLHGFAFNKTWDLKNNATFKTGPQWQKIFKDIGLKIIKKYPLPIRARLFYPVYRMQFILKV